MVTFFIGLAVLVVGGIAYGWVMERIFRPDNRLTPAVTKTDGVDFVPMKKWKNGLIQLLNIAGTGPILGPIQGILFGPIAFLTIPLGCVLGGAVHDYMCGMISVRTGGMQTPGLVKRYLGKINLVVYTIFVCLMMLLVGSVFIYTPGDIFVTQILSMDNGPQNYVIWIVYAAIFLYFLCATLFPIDKIIGKIYPIFGGILLISAVGVFIGIFTKGYKLDEIWATGVIGVHPMGQKFIPVFFVTVACGIVSGFHSTQSTLISRTVRNEREGRTTFYGMMIVEGFIAMVWAAAAMGIFNAGVSVSTTPTMVVGLIAKDILGPVGGLIAIIGVIVLPITSGDTALRSLRLMLSETLKIDQTKKRNRLLVSTFLFALVAAILVFAKLSADGFNVLWRYFAWANQTVAVFSFAIITVYMILRGSKAFIVALAPGTFYMFIVSSYILNAKIGFNLPWTAAYIVAGVLSALYAAALIYTGYHRRGRVSADDTPIFAAGEPIPIIQLIYSRGVKTPKNSCEGVCYFREIRDRSV